MDKLRQLQKDHAALALRLKAAEEGSALYTFLVWMADEGKIDALRSKINDNEYAGK